MNECGIMYVAIKCEHETRLQGFSNHLETLQTELEMEFSTDSWSSS